MRVSSLILGRVVDFDVDHDCALFELLAINGSGERRPVGQFSRRAAANGTTRTTYVVDLNVDREDNAPPTHFETVSRETALLWALWRLREVERAPVETVRRRRPRPRGAPVDLVDEECDPGPTVYRAPRLLGVAV